MSDALCVAHPQAVPWGAFKIKAVCQMHPVFAAWSPVCKLGPWCLPEGPNPLAPLCLSTAGCAGWHPSAALELPAWLHLCPGFSLMCSNSFPAAAPSLARHTCKSRPLPPHLSKTSQRTRHHPALIILRGKQEGKRELEMKCPLVSLQSHLPCCCGCNCARVAWRDSQKY